MAVDRIHTTLNELPRVLVIPVHRELRAADEFCKSIRIILVPPGKCIGIILLILVVTIALIV